MSDKTPKLEEKRKFGLIYKWFIAIFAFIVFEAVAVFSSFMFIDMKSKNHQNDVINIDKTYSQYASRIDDLERVAPNITKNLQRIVENTAEIKALSQQIDLIRDELGNHRISQLSTKTEDMYQRLLLLEETKNEEVLILSLALIIKENILYMRPYAQEVNILAEMAKNRPELLAQIQILQEVDNKTLISTHNIVSSYHNLIKDFYFKNENVTPHEETLPNKFSQHINNLKEKIKGINFDKLVIIKQNTNTEEDKKIISELTKAIDNYDFSEAVRIIDSHPQFMKADNPLFNAWFRDLKKKTKVDEAISHIISSQLRAFRESLNAQPQTKEISGD